MPVIGTVANKLYDWYWDRMLGIFTGGVHPSGTPSEANDNVECNPTPYRILIKVFSSMPIDDNEALIDFGCGKGRCVCFAAQFPFAKIYGIEISEHWASIATANVIRLRRKRTRRIEIVNTSATQFDCSEGTLFYFDNPFGQTTLSAVVDNIRSSLIANDRKIRLVYYNPVHRDLLEKKGWLRKTAVLHVGRAGQPAVILYEN